MKGPVWLTVSAMLLGIAEVPGPTSNPLIMRWAKDIGAPYENDETAWCAVFMNRLLQACGLPLAGTGYDLLRAKMFLGWGQACPVPSLGAVMVFARLEGGHVGLYLGETPFMYRIRGGNTGNAVADSWIAKDRLFAARWPTGITVGGTAGRVMLAGNAEPVSTNEA